MKFAGVSHPGLIGCAPDAALLARWNARERALVERFDAEANGEKVVPSVAYLPESHGAYVGIGSNASLADDLLVRIKSEGARTIPPREHGGNVDIKNLSRGSKVFFPVYVQGAKLSMGDLHFSQVSKVIMLHMVVAYLYLFQGDGELSFCGAIEVRKAGVHILPTYSSAAVDGRYSYIENVPNQRRCRKIWTNHAHVHPFAN